MISRRRWLAGWGLLATTYLTLGVVRGVTGGDLGGAVVPLVAAAVTFGFAAAVIPFVVPKRSGGDDDDASDGGSGPGGGPEPPPWWPEFERGFRRHAQERERERAGDGHSGIFSGAGDGGSGPTRRTRSCPRCGGRAP